MAYPQDYRLEGDIQGQLNALLDAAYGVLEHWSKSDLAAHVRHLQETVDRITADNPKALRQDTETKRIW